MRKHSPRSGDASLEPVDVRADCVIGVLRVFVAERVADFPRDTAEELDGLLERAVRGGQVLCDAGRQLALDPAAIRPGLPVPVAASLDQPLEHAAQGSVRHVDVEDKPHEELLVACTCLGDIGRAPPELLNKRDVLGHGRPARDVRPVGRLRPTRRRTILVEQHPVAHVESVVQAALSNEGGYLRGPQRPVDLDSVVVNDTQEARLRPVDVVLVAPTCGRTAIRRNGVEAVDVLERQDDVVVRELIRRPVGLSTRARYHDGTNGWLGLSPHENASKNGVARWHRESSLVATSEASTGSECLRLLGGNAVDGLPTVELGDPRRDKRSEALLADVRAEQSDVSQIEVSRPADVPIAVAVDDPGETRARTGRKHERANNARLEPGHPEARKVRLARPREHPQPRIEPHTVTARPAATRRASDPYADDLPHPRMLHWQHAFAASG